MIKVIAIALLAITSIGVPGCKNVTQEDGTTVRKVDVPKIKRAAEAIVPVLRAQALQAEAMPEFNETKKANIQKAMKALDAAYISIKALPDDTENVGIIVGSFAGAAQVIVDLVPMKPEQKMIITSGLAIIQVAAPLAGVILPDK